MRNSNQLTFVFAKPLTGQSGASLVLFLILLTLLSTLALGALRLANLNFLSSSAQKFGKKAFYTGEVGLDLAINDIISEFENLSIYTKSADYSGADSDGYMTKTYGDYTVKYKITNPVDKFLYQTVEANSVLSHYAYTYQIEGASESTKNKSRESLKETVRILETPLIQFFLFWGGSGDTADLELYPSSTFNAWGRVHANRNIYAGSYGGLKFRNYDTDGNISPHYVRAGGELFQLRKDTLSNIWGSNLVSVKAGNSTTQSMSPEVFVTQNITSSNESSEESRFNNYLLINETPYQTPSQKQLLRNGFYEQRADTPNRPGVDGMKIVGQGALGSGMSVWVSRPSLTDVTNMISSGTLTSGNVSTVITPMISETLGSADSSDRLCDNREGERWVNFTNIDLYKLETWYQEYLQDLGLTLGDTGFLIYASRSPDSSFTNSSGNMESIRFMQVGNSSSPQLLNETTVASDNPMYIKGDFNTVNTFGAGLVGDAHNVLSNAFTSKTCGQSVNDINAATETTVNAALIGGNVPQAAGSGDRAGGAHNYPRMHENWSGVDLNIRGSFINLGSSLVATGAWNYDIDKYRAPNREWGWDVRFENPDFWPPFIPSIFSVERVGFLE